jgi:hypothetical protein
MLFSVIVKFKTFTKHILSQSMPLDFFRQAKLMLQCNQKWTGLLPELDEAKKPNLFSKFDLA